MAGILLLARQFMPSPEHSREAQARSEETFNDGDTDGFYQLTISTVTGISVRCRCSSDA